jgi:hypothetical protein
MIPIRRFFDSHQLSPVGKEGWTGYTCEYAKPYCQSPEWGEGARDCCPVTCGTCSEAANSDSSSPESTQTATNTPEVVKHTHIHRDERTHTYTHILTHAHTHTHTDINAHTQIQRHKRTLTHTHTHFTHTYRHTTHTHTRMHTLRRAHVRIKRSLLACRVSTPSFVSCFPEFLLSLVFENFSFSFLPFQIFCSHTQLNTNSHQLSLAGKEGWTGYTCEYAKPYCQSPEWGEGARDCCPVTCGTCSEEASPTATTPTTTTTTPPPTTTTTEACANQPEPTCLQGEHTI